MRGTAGARKPGRSPVRGRSAAGSPWSAAFVLAALLALAPGPAWVSAQGRDGGTLRFGFSTSLLEDVNESDAVAAMTLWVRAVGIAAQVYSDAHATAFPDLASLMRAADSTDLFALSTTEYLSVENSLAGDPCMAYVVSGEVEIEYVVIARAGAASLAALRGQRLLVYNPSGRRSIADVWLDVLLMQSGLPSRERAFPDTRLVKKAAQAVLPLFFKQADVALVTRSAFDTAVELNPQIARDVTVVARSPRLLPGLICARKSMPPDVRRRYVEKATTIHETPQFKQTFMVLRMNRLAPWNPSYLDAARALTRQYQALQKKAGAR